MVFHGVFLLTLGVRKKWFQCKIRVDKQKQLQPTITVSTKVRYNFLIYFIHMRLNINGSFEVKRTLTKVSKVQMTVELSKNLDDI